MPRLYNHLRRIEMTTDYFTTKWIMTLYSQFLPFETLPKIFDTIFQDKWGAIYRLAIGLLKSFEEDFLTMDMVDMSIYLRENSRVQSLSVGKLLRSSAFIDIDDDTLTYLEQRFELWRAEIRMEENPELHKVF